MQIPHNARLYSPLPDISFAFPHMWPLGNPSRNKGAVILPVAQALDRALAAGGVTHVVEFLNGISYIHTYIPKQVHQSPTEPALNPHIKKDLYTCIFKVSAYTASTSLQPVFPYLCFKKKKKTNAQTQQSTLYMYN